MHMTDIHAQISLGTCHIATEASHPCQTMGCAGAQTIAFSRDLLIGMQGNIEMMLLLGSIVTVTGNVETMIGTTEVVTDRSTAGTTVM